MPTRAAPRRLAFVAAAAALAVAGYAVSRALPGNDVSRPVLAPAAAATVTVSTTAPARTTTLVRTVASERAPTSAAASFVPARTFLWTRHDGTTIYLATLTLDGRTVLERRTRGLRVRVPDSFRFRAGRYRWLVWALPRRPGKPPQAESQFLLPAAAAAAANRG